MPEDARRAESEADFQRAVWGILEQHSFWPWHDEDSRRDDPGFPDLWALNWRKGLLVLELKSETGRLLRCQEWWIVALRNARVRAMVLRPSQYDLLVDIIERAATTGSRPPGWSTRSFAADDLWVTGGFERRLTDAEMDLGPVGVAERYNETADTSARRRARRKGCDE